MQDVVHAFEDYGIELVFTDEGLHRLAVQIMGGWKRLSIDELSPVSDRYTVGTMLTAYFDESGLHAGATAFVLAGYLSYVQSWDAFAREWGAELARRRISHCHMRQLCHSLGEFQGWDENQRTEFLKRAIAIIGEHVMYGVACVIPWDSYRELSKRDVLNKVGDASVFCAVHHMIRVMTALGILDGLSLVFDERTKGTGIATRAYDNLCLRVPESKSRLLGIRFASDEEVVQLQAADLFAYEIHKFIADQLPVARRPPRKSFLSLIKTRHKVLVIGAVEEGNLPENFTMQSLHFP